VGLEIKEEAALYLSLNNELTEANIRGILDFLPPHRVDLEDVRSSLSEKPGTPIKYELCRTFLLAF